MTPGKLHFWHREMTANMDPRYRDQRWIVAQLEQDSKGVEIASARIDFATEARAKAAVEEFKAWQARAWVEVSPAEVIVEYDRVPHKTVALVIAKYEGMLMLRNPRVPR